MNGTWYIVCIVAMAPLSSLYPDPANIYPYCQIVLLCVVRVRALLVLA